MTRQGSAPDWDPGLYARFEAERTRPARDLLERVDLGGPRHIADLGCGPGTSTALLVARFPEAAVLGLDTSPAMIESARTRLPAATFALGEVARWAPATPPDLVFSNALLQWVPDHSALLPRLMATLRPGGVLAFQVPDNLDEPSHRAMRDLGGSPPWRGLLGGAGSARAGIVLAPEAYYDLLSPGAASVDVWRTTYSHAMPSADAIVDWFRATGLKPYLDPLPPGRRDAFLDDYRAAVSAAYPVRADGKRLMAFPRLFVVARRAE